MTIRALRAGTAAALVALLVCASVFVIAERAERNKTWLVGLFDNSNGIYVGDDVRILGVNVGKISRIQAQPNEVRIEFWIGDEYEVPATASAVIVSPAVVSARVIQLTPAYTGGALITSGTIIPRQRTAVPVEYDDLREQLKVLSDTLQPTQPGGVSTFGALVNASADNLRGQGVGIRDALVKASQAFSVLGDHSKDIFGTVDNLSLVVSALSGSSDVMGQLNRNLAAVSALLANDPDEVATAVADFQSALDSLKRFVEQNREALGVAAERTQSISQALAESIPDLKQTLHVVPNTAQNFYNIYKPALGSISAVPAFSNFSNPIAFICGAVQAASRLGAEQAAKLCVQYLAPIIKNRQYNFPPIGANLLPIPTPFGPIPIPITGAAARPNEITYSEEWMRPDYNPATAAAAVPRDPPQMTGQAGTAPPTDEAPMPLPAESPITSNPALGLPGLMIPQGRP